MGRKVERSIHGFLAAILVRIVDIWLPRDLPVVVGEKVGD